jgi:hypothetical protein
VFRLTHDHWWLKSDSSKLVYKAIDSHIDDPYQLVKSISLAHECFIGSWINTLIIGKALHHFNFTYGLLLEPTNGRSGAWRGPYIPSRLYQELVGDRHTMTLQRFLNRVPCSHERLGKIIQQAILALAMAYDYICFIHYDLHFANILITLNANPSDYTYHFREHLRRPEYAEHPEHGDNKSVRRDQEDTGEKTPKTRGRVDTKDNRRRVGVARTVDRTKRSIGQENDKDTKGTYLSETLSATTTITSADDIRFIDYGLASCRINGVDITYRKEETFDFKMNAWYDYIYFILNLTLTDSSREWGLALIAWCLDLMIQRSSSKVDQQGIVDQRQIINKRFQQITELRIHEDRTRKMRYYTEQICQELTNLNIHHRELTQLASDPAFTDSGFSPLVFDTTNKIQI